MTQMASSTSSLAPRLFASAIAATVLASASITFAASQAPTAAPVAKPAGPDRPQNLSVPDVTGEAYVFAKGVLQDGGFAWEVRGAQGYAVNLVVSQSPRPGTRVVDTGAPPVTLTLTRNAGYDERGLPESSSPYPRTALILAEASERAK